MLVSGTQRIVPLVLQCEYLRSNFRFLTRSTILTGMTRMKIPSKKRETKKDTDFSMSLVLPFAELISSSGSNYAQNLDTMSFVRLLSSSKAAVPLIDWSMFLCKKSPAGMKNTMQLAVFVTEMLQANTSTASMLLKAHGTKLLQRYKGGNDRRCTAAKLWGLKLKLHSLMWLARSKKGRDAILIQTTHALGLDCYLSKVAQQNFETGSPEYTMTRLAGR
jgi:hypothetical protein